MIQRSSLIRKDRVIFALTLIVTFYWYLPLLTRIYSYSIIGAIYEILWIFMILALFAVPVFSFISWAKTKFDLRSLSFYSLIISVISILFLVTSK